MTLEAIYSQLTELLREVFDDDTLVASQNLTADQVAGWDSFGHLRLIFAIEKTFRVKFAASEITSLQNVGELARLISSKVAD